MGRHSKPWLRTARNLWYVKLGGKQICLGPDKDEAFREWHRLTIASEPHVTRGWRVLQLCEAYLADVRHKLAHSTLLYYDAALSDWAASYGKMRIGEIRAYHLNRWMKSHATWNGSTQTSRAAAVKAWMSWVCQEGYCDVNYLRGARSPGISKRQSVPVELLGQVLAAVDNQNLKDLLIVLFDTGCRPGEIVSLEANQIDFQTSTAVVRGKRGQRLIGLSERSLFLLRKASLRNPSGPILRQSHGPSWTVDKLGSEWRNIRIRLNLPHHLVPYHLRHSFWSRAIKGGSDSVAIARQLGHVNLTQLVSRYASPDASQLVEVAEAAQVRNPPAPQHRIRGSTSKPIRNRKS